MNTLKAYCMEYIRKNIKNLLRDAYDQPSLDVPLDQIEDVLLDEIARHLNNDYKGVVRLIQIEKELMIKITAEEDLSEKDDEF